MTQGRTYRGYPPDVRVERGRYGYLLAPEHRAAIAAAAPGSTISDADQMFLEEIFGGFLRMRRRRKSILFSEERIRWERIAKLIPEYEPAMRQRAEAYIEFYATARAFSRREDPHRELLFWGVFQTWTNLGGELNRSKTPPGGPLFRFFLACIEPILGKETPAHSSIPKIIEREREARNRAKALFPEFLKLSKKHPKAHFR